MFKLIKKWFDEFNKVNADMAEQGITILHTPYGAYVYVDEQKIEKLDQNKK